MIVGDWVGGWIELDGMVGRGWNGSTIMVGVVVWLNGEAWVG